MIKEIEHDVDSTLENFNNEVVATPQLFSNLSEAVRVKRTAEDLLRDFNTPKAPKVARLTQEDSG
jgi:hypothetical protein